MPARLLRVIAVSLALTVVVGTGVAWGKIRSFESGINHISPIALGEGGEDGAIDILLVGMDSRTDAHGNPLSQEELETLRAGDDEATNTDTIILVRIPNNGKSATAISIPRDSYVEAPGVGKMKINGVYGSVHMEKKTELVEREEPLASIIAEGFDRDMVLRISRLLNVAEYKRRQAAPGVKVTRKNFGRDRRYPITNKFRENGVPLPKADDTLVTRPSRGSVEAFDG